MLKEGGPFRYTPGRGGGLGGIPYFPWRGRVYHGRRQPLPVPAEVEILPKPLNMVTPPEKVTASIKLSLEFRPEDIKPSTVHLSTWDMPLRRVPLAESELKDRIFIARFDGKTTVNYLRNIFDWSQPERFYLAVQGQINGATFKGEELVSFMW